MSAASDEGASQRPLAGARWLVASESRAVLAALMSGGQGARFVGGCVRDTLLDASLDPHDLDIATTEPPMRAIELLEATGIKVVPTGLAHGTITALLGQHTFEITTLRRDIATDGRHATVEFTDDFTADAARRDFTINAMSCDGSGRLFDPFDGRADLFAGRVRFVGEAKLRIREDYLRILRWFRFFARFGKAQPDAAAISACASEAAGVATLSGERLQKELFATLRLERAQVALDLMEETGVLPFVIPARVAPAALEHVAALRLRCDPLFALAAMLRCAGSGGDEASSVAHRLRLSRQDSQQLVRLTSVVLPRIGASIAEHRQAADVVGLDPYLDDLRLAGVCNGADRATLNQLLDELNAAPPPPFPVSGDDVVATGVKPGPEVGALLDLIRRWWRESEFRPDREECLTRLRMLRARGPQT